MHLNLKKFLILAKSLLLDMILRKKKSEKIKKCIDKKNKNQWIFHAFKVVLVTILLLNYQCKKILI